MTTQEMAGPSTEEFAGRIFDAGLKAMELATMYLGDKLGLYRALAEHGPQTPSALARATGLNERYVREWLEQQAVASVLSVDNASLAAAERTYDLPAEHQAALLDPDSPFHVAPIFRAAAVLTTQLQALTGAFRSGGGIPWQAFGPEAVDIQGDFNRPWLLGQLGNEFLPSVSAVHAALEKPGARVLDVACGVGWASIAIARAYPNARVTGIDIDERSIERARENAAAFGLEGRVDFQAADGATVAGGPYDFGVIVEAVHDMSDPVAVLASVRKALAPGASLLVVDERVADRFTAPGDEVERFMYAASVLLCLPTGMADQPSAATGTVMRASTLERYARAAGFKTVEALDIEHPMLRFYLLK
jgi:2-polyprenyl-3-methyl-5-hydroxy-6-metoxy-1,4-benzoquinol methylase